MNHVDQQLAFDPINLPSGSIISNRLVKVALYEHLATFNGGPPNEYHYRLYQRWRGYGMVLTGNTQVLSNGLTLGRDLVIPVRITPEIIAPFKKLADVIHNGDNGLAIMQLSHAGRQSANIIGGRWPFVPPIAPSPVRVTGHASEGILAKAIYALMFQTPREMSMDDIGELVDAFVRGAVLAEKAGFDGIQLHVAHGYLLAQFMSSKTNKRTDEYSYHDLKLLHRIILSIRAVVPSNFVLGIKMNASDYVDRDSVISPAVSRKKDEQEKRALDHVCAMARWGGIDFIEISGGDYESPGFMSNPGQSPRQAFFAQFSRKAKLALSNLTHLTHPRPLILLTGGIRTPSLVDRVLNSGHADLIGLGRVSVLVPNFPHLLKTGSDFEKLTREPDMSFPRWIPKLPVLVGAGAGTAWYNVRMRNLSGGRGEVGLREVSTLRAVFEMWIWVESWTVIIVAAMVFVVVGMAVALALPRI